MPYAQWRSRPKNFGETKMFDFRITLFCLEKRLSKHKMTYVLKIWGWAWPLWPILATPMFTPRWTLGFTWWIFATPLLLNSVNNAILLNDTNGPLLRFRVRTTQSCSVYFQMQSLSLAVFCTGNWAAQTLFVFVTSLYFFALRQPWKERNLWK